MKTTNKTYKSNTAKSTIIILLLISFTDIYPKEILRWAADAESNAPYIFCNPDNPTQLIGFEYDIAKAIAKQMNMDDMFVQNQWDGLIPGLERNDYNIAINGLEITGERIENINFSKPYFITSEQIVVRHNQKNIKNLEELKGKNVGALKYSQAETILNEYGGINVKSYEGEVNSFADLNNGRLDAVLVDAPIAMYYASWDKRFKLTGEPVGEILYGIAIKKTDTLLLQKINLALDELMKSGKLREILEEWNLWNNQMAKYLNDFSPSKTKPIKYDTFVSTQLGETGFQRTVKRYFGFIPLFLEAALVTLGLSMLAMLLAIVFGLIIALIRIFAPFPFSKLAVWYIEIIRGTPLLIQLFFIYYALPVLGLKFPPFIVAIIGLGLNYAAYEAENYRAGLFAVAKGQMEAAIALGMRRRHALRYIIIPQAIRVVIPPITNDFISLLKDSSLVSVITMVELTKVYGQIATTYYDWIGPGILVAAIYLLLGLPFVRLSKYAEKRLTHEFKNKFDRTRTI